MVVEKDALDLVPGEHAHANQPPHDFYVAGRQPPLQQVVGPFAYADLQGLARLGARVTIPAHLLLGIVSHPNNLFVCHHQFLFLSVFCVRKGHSPFAGAAISSCFPQNSRPSSMASSSASSTTPFPPAAPASPAVPGQPGEEGRQVVTCLRLGQQGALHVLPGLCQTPWPLSARSPRASPPRPFPWRMPSPCFTGARPPGSPRQFAPFPLRPH